MRLKLIAAALTASALLSGCASTTHTIAINPTTTPIKRQLSNSHLIKVEVVPYSTKEIGNIKTGIGEQANIVVGNNASTALLDHTRHLLRELGMTPDHGMAPARILTMEIEQLSYTTRTIALKTEATLISTIKATVEHGDDTYTATFTSKKVDEYGTLPDREVVEKEMNQLLGQTVGRAFDDPQLITLLTH